MEIISGNLEWIACLFLMGLSNGKFKNLHHVWTFTMGGPNLRKSPCERRFQTTKFDGRVNNAS